MGFPEPGRFLTPGEALSALEVVVALLAAADPPIPAFSHLLGKTGSKQWEFGAGSTEGQMYLHEPPSHPQNMGVSSGSQAEKERKYPSDPASVCASLQGMLPGIQNGGLPGKQRIPWRCKGKQGRNL